jgi:hypothetical protein
VSLTSWLRPHGPGVCDDAGASLSCPGDGQQALLCLSYLGLNGRVLGRVTRIKRQTPIEAMLTRGKDGKVNTDDFSTG